MAYQGDAEMSDFNIVTSSQFSGDYFQTPNEGDV